jgi:hypothetical protein
LTSLDLKARLSDTGGSQYIGSDIGLSKHAENVSQDLKCLIKLRRLALQSAPAPVAAALATMTTLTYLTLASQISSTSTGTREVIPLLLRSVRVLQLEGLTVRQLAAIQAPQLKEVKNLQVEVELNAAAKQVRLEGAQLWSFAATAAEMCVC